MMRTEKILAAALIAFMATGCKGGDSDGDTETPTDSDTDTTPGLDIDEELVAETKLHFDPYQDPLVAIQNGYFSTAYYQYVPTVGIMGVHFVSAALSDAEEDLAPTNAALNYNLTEEGEFVLLSAEWMIRDDDRSLIGSPPSIFGVPFTGPMPPHNPTQGEHWDLHAYWWAEDTSGTLYDGVWGEYHPQFQPPSWVDDYNIVIVKLLDPATAAAYTQTDGTCVAQLGIKFTNPSVATTGTPDPKTPNSIFMHDFGGGMRPASVEWVSDAPGQLYGHDFIPEGDHYVFRMSVVFNYPNIFIPVNQGIVCPV